MVDVSKLRNRTLGKPPSDPSGNLKQPESAPRHSGNLKQPVRAYDGRTARRTDRVVQFATRITPEFDVSVREYAERHGLLLVEVLELGHEALLEKERAVI